jgi:hypothetical protein
MREAIALTPVPEKVRSGRKLDIVFVHGLGDNDRDAWQDKNDPSSFWPRWLAEDFDDVQIWILRYAAAKFWFEGTTMVLPDRAKSVLAYLIDNKLGQRDLLFITHSLGGLVVKQLLETSKTNADIRLEAIAKAARGVVFLATPHTGSNVATIASRLGIASKAVAGLQTDDPWLKNLDDWYRNNARSLGWKTRVLYETLPMGPSLVVSNSNADPHIEGITAIPVDADHVGICKPSSKTAPVYMAVEALVRECLDTARPEPAPPRPGTTYFTAPALPLNYVERADALAELRKTILANEVRPSIAITALQGMAGIGKTVLAQALCHDKVIQKKFPDGVIWISVGKESAPDLATRLREVGKAFGDDLAAYDSELGSTNRYRTIVRDKAALIVLDDVWDTRDIEPFRAESPSSRLLFTTRDESIAAGTGAQLVTPGFLTPEQSRDMLARWSGLSVNALPPDADDLIRECDGLPLAVATIGAMLRGKLHEYWQHVHNLLRNADLGKIQQQFPNYPYPHLLRALQVSVDALDQKTLERYMALAVLLENTPVHPLIQRVLWNADASDALETAEELVRLALAQRAWNDGSIRLHDLLLDYVRAQYPNREALGLIRGAMSLSAGVIARDPGQFASQLVGRLLPYMGTPKVQDFTQALIRAAPRPWLRPLKPVLQSQGAGLLAAGEGRADSVRAVAVTPDGRRAVSASRDGTLQVWELESGRELLTLQGHRRAGSVRAVAVTPDGRRAVSASRDGMKVWELERGRELQTLQGHAHDMWAVAVTPDSRCAVSASFDKALKVWDLESGCELRSLEGHTGPVYAVAVTPDGRRAVSASKDKTLKVWDLESGCELRTLEGHTGWVNAVAVTPDGRRAVSASWDKTLKVWESRERLRTADPPRPRRRGYRRGGDAGRPTRRLRLY